MSRIQNKKTDVQHRQIDAAQAGRRIDNYLTSQFKGLPKARLYRLLRKGEVRVNGRRIKPDYRLQVGDDVRLPPVTPAATREVGPPRVDLVDRLRGRILYEDEHLLALDKPAGIVVHSGSGRSVGVIEIMRHLRGTGGDLQLVHRLDRETSGVLLLAKDYPTLKALQDCFAGGSVKKCYLTFLTGTLPAGVTEVDKPLQRNVIRSGERLSGVSPGGKHALTRFRLLERHRHGCLVRAEIKTGRTHQIRVHAAAIGHPVAGDDKYGDKQVNRLLRQHGLKRLFLHAAALELPPILDQKTRIIEAPLPQDLSDFLAANG